MTAAAMPGPALPPGWTLLALDRVGSTNDEARRRAAEGAADRTMVWARRQDAGRGRRGRGWVSPEGNLFCTAILRPDCAAPAAGQISFLVALGLHDALTGMVPGLDVRLKWPNDVLVQGCKISGILLESATRADGTIDWLVAGLGVNVVEHPDDQERPAISLAAAGAAGVTAEAVLERYVLAFDLWLERWRAGGFSAVREAWISRARGLGERILVRLDHETLSGTFEDLDSDGTLLLRLDDGSMRRITAGDVFFASAPPGPAEA